MSHKEFFSDQFGPGRVLDAAGVGYTEVYIAYATLDPETEKVKDVTAIAVLTRWYSRAPYWNYGWKSIHENSDPWACRCPQRILEQLTPTNNSNALEWRRKCWERIKRRAERPEFREGDLILFPHRLEWSDGSRSWVMEVAKLGRRLRFRPIGSTYSRYYQVRREALIGARLIASAQPRDEGATDKLIELLQHHDAAAVGGAYEWVRSHKCLDVWHSLSHATSRAEAEDAVITFLQEGLQAVPPQPETPALPQQMALTI